MDRISDSGSDGCGSIPHGGTKMTHGKTMSHFLSQPLALKCLFSPKVAICTTDRASGSIRGATSWRSEA